MSNMRNDNKRRVLILGGSGFVGPALVKVLLTEGAEVTLLNRGTRHVPNTALLKADRNEPGDMRAAAVGVESFDAVIDLSCYTLAQARLAWEAFSPKAAIWIHLSSAAVYSTPPSITPHEGAATGGAPIWGDYGRDKSRADEFLLGTEGGLPAVTILRPPYLYGPGNDNDRETFVWSRVLRGRPVLVPGDGATPIQFLHVEDLAAAVMHIVGQRAMRNRVYNIAQAEQVTLKEFVTRLAAICGEPDPSVLVRDADYGYKPRDYFPFRDYPCRVNAELIKHDLGWSPKYDFDSGFAATYETYDPQWLRERPLEITVEDQIIERFGAAGGSCGKP